jgi:hypothetical protein
MSTIDHEPNEKAQFSTYNRLKNSEAVRSRKWQMFHIAFVLLMLWANIHYEWNTDGRAVGFMAAIGSLYLAGIIIACRDAATRWRSALRG